MNQIVSNVLKFAQKNSSTILTILAATGVVSTAVMAAEATPHAMKHIEEKNAKTKWEKIKAGAPSYIPTAIMGGTTIACMIGAQKVNLKRQAALATAYSTTRIALNEFQEKAVAEIGAKKVKKIKDEIAKEKMEKTDLKGNADNQVIITEKGNHLVFDCFSGRYFRSDIEDIRKMVNDLNAELNNSMFVSINEFYYAVGLAGIKQGDDIGWNIDDGHIDISFSSQIAPDGSPCLVMDYLVGPRFDYKSLH